MLAFQHAAPLRAPLVSTAPLAPPQHASFAGLSAFQQVVPGSHHEQGTRLVPAAVPGVLQGEIIRGKAELLTSEGLKGPMRADKRKPKAGAC
jgi:hypothetical protein